MKIRYLLFTLMVIGIIASSFINNKSKHGYQFVCGVPPNMINTTHLDSLGNIKFVFDPRYRWRSNTLSVYFIDIDDTPLKERTLKIANIWSKYANIHFEPASDIIRSDIRVSFREKNSGYKSFIGSDAEDLKNISTTTLWLENLDKESKSEFKRVILHEFGHALGLLHELQSPNSNIIWDSLKVYDYYKKVYKWDKDFVNNNIFKKAENVEYSKFDYKSIMIYAIPDSLTKNNTSIPWSNNLSSLDKEKIVEYYPY